jgi:hypothetical protein
LNSIPATTIDEVIDTLEGILRETIAEGSRLGYFAALYNRVTQAVREAIAAGRFDDGERMERLDVIFANRYLTAYREYRSGEMPSRAWLQAFEAARSDRHIILQHLFIGMNAHINLDLGIAAARVAPGAGLAGLEGDFNRINDILASLTPTVELEIDMASPEFKDVTGLAPKLELHMIGLGMRETRDRAWKLAQTLAPLDPCDQVAEIARRDDEAVVLGEVIVHEGLATHWIWSRESRDVGHNIEILASGEFRVWGAAHDVPAPGQAGTE